MGEFQKGKYARKTIEEVAAIDPLYLIWFSDKIMYETPFTQRTRQVVEKLLHFLPSVKCGAQEEGCEGTSRLISIARSYDQTGIIGISASTAFTYCRNPSCVASIMYEKPYVYPIDFRIIENFEFKPKWVRKDALEVLLQCAGVPSRITKESAKKWIDELKIDPEEIKKDAPYAGIKNISGKDRIVRMPLSGVHIESLFPIPKVLD